MVLKTESNVIPSREAQGTEKLRGLIGAFIEFSIGQRPAALSHDAGRSVGVIPGMDGGVHVVSWLLREEERIKAGCFHGSTEQEVWIAGRSGNGKW